MLAIEVTMMVVRVCRKASAHARSYLQVGTAFGACFLTNPVCNRAQSVLVPLPVLRLAMSCVAASSYCDLDSSPSIISPDLVVGLHS